MKLAKTSVRRPIGVTMVMSIVTLFGILSFYKLPVDLMPDMTYPTITVSANYSDASPTEVETLITRPIEQAVSAISGVEEINSTSNEGSSRVRISFSWGTDLDAASNDLRDRIDRIIRRLPDDIERPSIRKFDAAATPILVLGASSDLDPVQMLELIEDQVKYRIERINGVASIDILGGNQREIQVQLNIDRLSALKIAPETIINRIKAENLNLPAGMIELGNYELRLRTPGEFENVNQIANMVVGETGGKLIRLRDVANVKDHWEKKRSVVRINQRPGVRIMVYKQSGSNTVSVAHDVKKEIEAINEDLPQLHLSAIIDSSKYIERSIKNVSSSALLGGALAVLILLVFLANITSTIIIAIAIPVSIIATFALMYYFGFTLNIMSLGGVALGIGMLVDNSIVVLENIFRYREKGQSKIDASINGATEVAMPILASTLTTVGIFLPLMFIEGMSGIMFKQLAYIVSFSLLCSMAISLTIVPMMSSLFLNITASNRKNYFQRLSEKGISKILSIHAIALDFVLKHKTLTVFVLALILASSLTMIKVVDTEFMPQADEGEVRVTLEMEEGTRLSLVEKIMIEAEKIIYEKTPEAEVIFTNVGGGRSSNVAIGNIRIPLISASRRTRSSAQIAGDLRKHLSALPGTVVRTREGRGMFMMGSGGGTEKLQLQIRGHDIETADSLGKAIERMLYTVNGITDVQLSRDKGVPERVIVINREKAADQKLTISKISAFLETMMSGTSAGNLREDGNEYRILVKASDAEYMSLDHLLNLQVTNNIGKQVMLRNIAHIESKLGPTLIERRDQERILNVSANFENRGMGEIIKEVQEKLHSIPMPARFSVIFAGDYEEQQEAYAELAISFALALLLVYMIMAIQYEAFSDPIIVMTTVPMSVISVLPVLYFTDTSFNVQSFIGCIMLGGIVVNNSILLVDHINDLLKTGVDKLSAVKEAARDRCRPILMTALTTILGLLPLAIGIGEGGEVQAPMAKVVIAGLSFATLVSLLIIPLVYIEFTKAFSRFKGESK
ncbi:efflux RND transporter permease subunit [bacterium]|nr:efflux RND transporter permease subunit [bacterium]